MNLQNLVLLFYDGYELKAREGLIGQTYSAVHRFARHTYRSARRKQVRTGFYTAFLALVQCLEQSGCDVRINDFATARAHPQHPIGVAGYVSVLDYTNSLPNPRVFGPGDFGDPKSSVQVAKDPRWKALIQPCDWFVDLYRPYCGSKMTKWFAGIDTNKFEDCIGMDKSIDVLIYDKIRWDHDAWKTKMVDPIITRLDKLNRSYKILRYGHHHQAEFVELLRRSKSLLFLCEHETQGLAYQEAMSMNVPVLAWDEGRLIDPLLRQQADPNLVVTSVPYFDERCGGTFTSESFDMEYERFWSNLKSFAPRSYVDDALSMSKSARLYLDIYHNCGTADFERSNA